MPAPRTAIIGIGNPLMGDDGIGPRLISELQGRAIAGIDPIDLSTGGIKLVHELARYDRVVIVDAAEMGIPPGDHRTFLPEEAVSAKFVSGYSLHDWDVMRSIQISKELGEAPSSITIFAIQPGSIREGAGISPSIEDRIGEYLLELRGLVEKSLGRSRP